MQAVDDARPLPQPLGVHAVLVARLEHHLHADADAEHGTAAGETATDDLVAAHGAQALHHGGERTDPGHDEAVSRLGGGTVVRQLDLGADALERTHRRADVPEAVVEDDDGRRTHDFFLALRARDASRRAALSREYCPRGGRP